MRPYLLMSFLRPLPERARRQTLPLASSGSSLIELLVGCVIALLTGAALVSLQQSNYVAVSSIQGQNLVNTSSRQPLDVMGDTLRNAQSRPTASGSQTLDSASGSDVTCYTGTTMNMGTTRIWLDVNTHTLRRAKTDQDGTVTTENILSGVQSLQLTYYMPGGSAYNAQNASWTTTADPNAPASAELPNIGGVGILATVSLNGETRTLQNFVRLRNSPTPSDS